MEYSDLQKDMAQRGFVFTPISEEEYNGIINSGLGYEEAISIALDVACGIRMHDAWEACLNNLIKESYLIEKES